MPSLIARAALAATTLTCVSFAPATTQSVPNPVDPIFAPWNGDASPGCAVGVVGSARTHRLLYSKGYGIANLDYGIPNAPDMVFYVGSVSKQFTAASVALLVLDGAISLDDDVRTHIPELPAYDAPITIRHLVHHTSGLRDIYVLMDLAGIRMEDVVPDEDALALIARQNELNFSGV
jgi:CubicO group peptidase (beta-lactamase class C family)